VEVGLSYYVPPAPVDDTVVSVKDFSGRTLQTVTGVSCWHPATRRTLNGDGTFTPAPLPHYVIVTVNASMEVVVHAHRDNVFSISDDPSVVGQARESIARGECRKTP
jgi:hypothetical protein